MPRRAFTLVEILVLIGIVVLLLGLLLPALGKVRARVRKSAESADLRQVGLAWSLYAAQHDDQLLPGYLGIEAQAGWRVTYRYHDGSPIPPGPDYDAADPNHAGPWAWRLMPYLDYSHRLVLGHRDKADRGTVATRDDVEEIARNPAFGYNGLFLGGWWTGPRTLFFEQVKVVGSDRRVPVISRSLGGVRRPGELVTFAAAALRPPGLHRYQPHEDDEDATFLAMAPNFADRAIWGAVRPRALDGATGGGDGGDDGPTDLAGGSWSGDAMTVEVYGQELEHLEPPHG